MTAPNSDGAAFNAAIRTEDNAPEPPEGDQQKTTDAADDGQVTETDQG